MTTEEPGRAAPLSGLFAVLLASLALLWPALVNGRPPVFADTAYYFSLGETASEAAGLTAPRDARVAPADPTRLAHDAQGRASLAYTLIGARAPTYAVLLYWTQRLGSLWLTAWLQSLAVAWTLWLMANGAAPRRPLAAFAAAVGVGAGLTPLPFFVPFIMPDVFGGVAAACGLALLVWWDRYGRAERAGLVGLLLFSLTLHGSHPLTAAALAVAGGLLLWSLGAGRSLAAGRAAGLILLAVSAVALDAGGFAWLARTGGEPLGRPPFLTARLLADGPGRGYLRRACAADPSAYVVCPDAAKPLTNSEAILWADNPALGVFSPSSFQRRLAMSAQDGRFARAVLLHDPLGVARSALRNWGLQIARGYVDDPLTNMGFWMQNHFWRRTNLEAISPDPAPCLSRPGCPAKTPFKPLKTLHLWTAGLAAVWLGLRLAVEAARRIEAGERPLWTEPRTRLFAAVLLAVAAVLINAAVCGMISGPFPRYQARVVWLLPAMVALLEVGLLRAGRRPTLTPPLSDATRGA